MSESSDKTGGQRLLAAFAAVCLAAAVFCCLPVSAFAAPPPCSGIPSVSQISQLNLSTLQIPSGTSTFTVSPSGTTAGTGTQLFGMASNGEFSISEGSSKDNHCSTITINVIGTNCGTSGCTLGSWTGKYGSRTLSGPPPWTGLPTPGKGQNLFLGTTATYNGTVGQGNFAPGFTLSVNYDSAAPTTFPETGAIGFDLPLSIDTISNINIGHVQANTTGIYTIDTSGNVTTSGGQWLSGSPSAGRLLIHGSATQTISISAGSYVAGGAGGGVTLSNVTCAYNGGAAVPCSLATQAAPTAGGKTLLLGVTVTVGNKSQADGSTATPSFTITVTYS